MEGLQLRHIYSIFYDFAVGKFLHLRIKRLKLWQPTENPGLAGLIDSQDYRLNSYARFVFASVFLSVKVSCQPGALCRTNKTLLFRVHFKNSYQKIRGDFSTYVAIVDVGLFIRANQLGVNWAGWLSSPDIAAATLSSVKSF